MWAHSPLRAVLHCHSPGVATVARHLRIDVYNDSNDNNDDAWQRGPLWPHGMGPKIPLGLLFTVSLSTDMKFDCRVM